jgi:hypothetical protein
MIWVTDMLGKLLDLLVGLLGGSSLLVMVAVSVVTAVWALLLFKAVTPQARLTAVRDRLFGHIYELGLYQDHLRVVSRIQGDLAKANRRYLVYSLPALIVLTIPMVFTLTQLNSLYQFRPFQTGETTVLSVTLAEEAAGALGRLTLETPGGVSIEAGPVRDVVSRSVAWRLRADNQGTHPLRILDGAKELGSRDLVVGQDMVRLGETSNKSWLNVVLNPGAPPLPGDGSLDGITMILPERHSNSLSLGMPWWLLFFIFTMLAGLALKDFLRVSI